MVQHAVPVLREMVRDKDPLARRLACAGLANIGPDAADAVEELSAVLGDPDMQVRATAALGLSRIGLPARSAIPALIHALRPDEDIQVRGFAAEALSAIDPDHPDAVAALVKTLEVHDSPRVQHPCIWGLAKLRMFEQPGVVPALTRAMSEPGPEFTLLRYEAANALALGMGRRIPDKALDVLAEALRDDTIQLYTGTGVKVQSSANEGRRGAAQVRSTGEGDWRVQVARALLAVGRRANRKDILDGLDHVARRSPDPRAREGAKIVLESLKGS
jgi:HEAT repeat protein